MRADPAATDELVTIRRGFHTLKGSGRMVGLAQLGDTAWAVEQTLNRWLQLDWPVTPALIAFIDAGERLFSTWIERLSSAGAEPVDAAQLVAEAERLCAAETPPLEAPAAPHAAELPSAAPTAVAASEDADWSYEAMLDETWKLADGDTADELVLLDLDASEEPALTPPAAADAAAAAEAGPWPDVPELPAITEFGLAGEDIGFAIDDEFELPAAPAAASVPAAGTTAEAGAHETTPPVATEAPEVLRIGDIELSRALYELFCAEAAQHLDTLDAELHALRSAAPRPPASAALRAAHTLAGIAGTAHVPAMHQLGRALENAIERLIDAGAAARTNDLALLADAAHTLRAMLVQVLETRQPKPSPELVAALDAVPQAPLAPAHEVATVPAMPVPPPLPAAPAAPRRPAVAEPVPADDIDHALLPIFLEEAAETTTELHATLRRWREMPGSAEPARGVARLLHSLKGSARMAGAMALGALLHQLESRLEDGVSAQEAPAALVDELTLGLDRCEQLIDALALGEPAAPAAAATELAGEAPAPTAAPEAERAEEAEALSSPTLRVRAELVDRFVNQAGEIGVARSRINGELRTLRRSLLDLTENVIRLRSQLREVEIQAEVQMQSRIALAGGDQADFDPLELDRYTRLQELTRMMAESVNDVTTVQQNLLQNLDGADLALNSQARMARELQQGLMQVRMLPFDSLAARLYRVVRQSARELGKRATLDLRGGRIEIDRSVLEQMAAPLEHLLRNAVAHGIEAPAERAAAGKPESGSIVLTVSQEGNEIAIEIADDGAGLDLERIAARARERGLIGAHEHADERRLTNLIFVSGFSTASELSAVSGRGVGMDVVKAQTAAAGGRVDVSSRRGAGTRFHLRLPLTLAVTQALLVEAGGRSWAVPSNMIVQALELKPDALRGLQDEHGLDWQGERFPYRYLPRLLGDREARPVEQRYNWVLLLRAGAQTLALHVDGLRGNQEIIVKNAGPQLTRIVGMSGATVLGDGEIVLILNPVALASRSLAQADAGEPGETPASEAPAPLHLPTVMVVDDSLTVRKITGRLLEREGYRVLTAKDGVDALEQLIDTVPDVVLSDIEMPRMDGFDLVRNIRADARLRHLPVIMITSRLAEKHRRYAEEVGASHYLGKPYQEEQLLALVAGYTRAKEREEADLLATA